MSPRRRISIVLRRAGSLEDESARAQLRILNQIRRAIMADLTEALGFDRLRLFALLSAVDGEIARGASLSVDAAMQNIRDAFGLGEELVRSIVDAGRLTGLSPELLHGVVEVTTEQLRAVWAELGTRLRTVIRRVALGVTDPYEGMKALARAIRDPKTFGRAFNRAETIVRTEVNRTFSMSSHGEMERGATAGVAIRKYWLPAHDSRVRHAHMIAGEEYSLEKAIPWDEAFVVDGEKLMYPLDPKGSAGNTINCFLPGTRIGGRVLVVSKAWYAGTAWRIETARGYGLSVTLNHPVLTSRGWLPAHEIREGDHLLAKPADIHPRAALHAHHVDDQDPEAVVDEVFETLSANGRLRLRVASGLDFHGDATRFSDPDIDVVAIDGEILSALESRTSQRQEDAVLVEHAVVMRASLARDRTPLQFGGVSRPTPTGSVSGGNLVATRGPSHRRPLQPLLLGLAAQFDTPLPEDSVDGEAAGASCRGNEAVSFREAQDRLTGLVATDQVVRVRVDMYAGPVFDVQTDVGWLHSNGIITHNCRCVSVPVVPPLEA